MPPDDHAEANSPVTPTALLTQPDPSTLMDVLQQQLYLTLLTKGASPAAACAQMGIPLPLVASTLEADEGFRQLFDRVHELLSQNVAAALYRSAMEGRVSAQTFYLKNKPPPEWPHDDGLSDSNTPSEMTDDELLDQYRQNQSLLRSFLAGGDVVTDGTSPSDDLPTTDSSPR